MRNESRMQTMEMLLDERVHFDPGFFVSERRSNKLRFEGCKVPSRTEAARVGHAFRWPLTSHDMCDGV